MTISKLGSKYDKTISILNRILNDKEYLNHFKNKNTYIPLIVVRSYEPRIDPYEDQPNLITKEYQTYYVKTENKFNKKTTIQSKYNFNIELLQKNKFITHLKKHNIYVKSMFSYINGLYETYLMVYYTDYHNEFEFENYFNFLLLNDPEPKKGSKCVIS